jgi:hypothetical protein
MKTTNVLIGAALLCLVHTTSDAGALDVPEDYKEHANQVEFLSHLASRCDTHLSISGKSALTHASCTDFLAKIRSVMTVDKITYQRWVKVGEQVDKSKNQEIHLQWDTFHARLMRDMALVSKTQDHIKFVR